MSPARTTFVFIPHHWKWVPRVETYGTFSFGEIISPEDATSLAVLANWMERSERAYKAVKKSHKAASELVGRLS